MRAFPLLAPPALTRSMFAVLGLVALAMLGQPLPTVAAGFPIDPVRGIPSLAPVVEKVADGVVTVISLIPGTPNPARPKEIPVSPNTGSGVIVDAARGYILTNAHVVEDAAYIVVQMRDGRSFDARVVGSDPATDIAVLSIPPDRLQAVSLGSSYGLRVGDLVLAVGNPFGLGQTITSGIISALGRGLNAEGFEDFIQTDAAINPGNSGGALIDVEGNLIGLSTAIIGPGANIGIGFAVPIDLARVVMQQLIEFGEVRRAQIGIQLTDVPPALVAEMGHGGAMIGLVAPDSPADLSGLQAGDVVTAMDGIAVRDARELFTRLGVARVGTTVHLTVRREAQTLEIDLRLNSPLITAAN
mgnify:CR=1 FL=1